MVKSVYIYRILLVMVIGYIPLSSAKPLSFQEDKVISKIVKANNVTRWKTIRKAVLDSRYRYRLEILPSGTVRGTTNYQSKYTQLELHSIGHGIMRIYGTHSKLYLSINDKGQLVGQKQPTLNTVFKELYLENYYQSFQSYKYKDKYPDSWLVGIKRNGKAKRATATQIGQTSTQFVE